MKEKACGFARANSEILTAATSSSCTFAPCLCARVRLCACGRVCVCESRHIEEEKKHPQHQQQQPAAAAAAAAA
uniref:Uncharacterized protein n=1 Tax=Anopheles albimanus TaxID=7167 RepID=A0A182FZF9_ANOAL